jgi:hypothetical protein
VDIGVCAGVKADAMGAVRTRSDADFIFSWLEIN